MKYTLTTDINYNTTKSEITLFAIHTAVNYQNSK